MSIVPQPRAIAQRGRLPLAVAVASALLLAPAMGQVPQPGGVPEGHQASADRGGRRARWVELARILETLDHAGGAGGRLQFVLSALETEDRRWRAEQVDSERRVLPPKAVERRARAREAYAAGQGRLLALVRSLSEGAAAVDSAARSQLLGEARELVGRLERASRPQPISVAQPRVFVPRLQAPSLLAPTVQASAPGGTELPAEGGGGAGSIPKALRDAAAQLDGPAGVYDWVRTQIRPEFYYGRMKGALQAYLDGSGNDADTAAVLVEMMRAKNIPARYVRGTVFVPANTLVALTGTEAPEQAVRVLERAAIPHQAVAGGGGIAAVRIERVWAEAYVPYANYRGTSLDAQGKVWVSLDAAFKPLEPLRGIDVVRELGYAPRQSFDEYLQAARSATPLAFVRDEVTALLAQQRPDITYEAALNSRVHTSQLLGLLPSSLPYVVVARHDVAYSLPATLDHVVHVTGEGEAGPFFDLELPLSDVIGRRLTLSYVPLTEEDRLVVARYGGMHKTPPYLFEVKPVLKSDGVAVASGDSGIGMAVAYTLSLEIKTPSGALKVSNRVLAGNLTAIGLAGRAEGAPAPPGETAAQILDSVARDFFRRWNRSDEELSNLLRVAPVRPTVSACLTASDVEVDHAGGDPQYPITFEWKGILIDADLRASAPVALSRTTATAERDFLLLSGLEGSVLEDRVFSDGLHVNATSTAAALGQAAAEGITVYELTSANAGDIVPGLPLDPAVKEEVLEAVARGLTVRLPAAEVSRQAWTGVGYLLLDPETGEAAWQLQGGHSGGVTVPAVTQFPREIVDPLEAQGEAPAPAPPGTDVTQIFRFGSTDFQFGTVNTMLNAPLKVLVTDDAGLVIAGVPVTFRVMGGGAVLVDPVTGEPGLELTVLSNDRGEASAPLLLGRKTDVIPRYLLFEGDEYSTQAGLNLVTASSGRAVLDEPFRAFGLPDSRFDGTYSYADLANVSQEWEGFTNLSVAGQIAVSVSDPYGNPLSNFPIRVAYKAPPVQREAPDGWVHVRGPNTTPAHVLAPAAYEVCRQASPIVLWGECPGEAEVVTVNSSVNGATALPVIGDSPGSYYNFLVGTELTPEELTVTYRTWGFICHGADPSACGHWSTQPHMLVFAGGRPQLVNRLGNMIEAYPTGGRAPIGYWADVLFEKERILKDEQGRYTAEGTNSWRRERLFDSQFTLRAGTPDTGVDPVVAPHVGGGLYASEMILAGAPELNTVLSDSKHYPLEIPYMPFDPEHVNPAFVTDGNPPTVTRVKRPQHPLKVTDVDFSLWGAQAELTDLAPTPVLLAGNGLVVRESAVAHRILPEEFSALLDPRDVLFAVEKTADDGTVTTILTASGAEPGGFRVPVGLPVPPGSYTGTLSVLGTSLDDGRIEAPPMPVPVCGVVELRTREVEFGVVRDADNDVTCGDAPSIVFNLCWDAKVTLRVAGQVLTARLDGGAPAPIDERTLSAGVHVVSLGQDLLGLASDARKPFTIDAAALEDPALKERAEGMLVNQLRNRPLTRVGRTFVKGVDLLDGHVVRSAVDFSVPGRHLGLEVSRAYSSFGSSSEGVMGGGWSWSYGAGLFVSDCGLVNVVTPSGDSQVFRTTDNHVTYAPQKGYHTRLVRNGDLSYDFFDKAGLRHHFREPEDPDDPGPSRRLEYIEEPHGDRILLTYDGSGLVTRVAEVHPESGEVRALALTYQTKGGSDRIRKIMVPALALQVDYEHDAFGNLVGVRRTGANVDGQPAAAPRTEGYRYSFTNGLDRHQLLSYRGPNGELVDYVYLAAGDTFLGEQSAALLQKKEEYAKEVREVASSARTVTTRFDWDYREASALRFKTTVRDGRGNPTTYVMNGRGSPLEIQEPLGRTTSARWASGDILKTDETDALGRLTEYGYDASGNLTRELIHTADLGLVETRYEYDPRFNKLTFKRDAEGRESHWEIHPQTGDLLSMTDAAGNVTRYEYDPQGRLTKETSPREHHTLHSGHDTFGNALTLVDPLGNATTRAYDERGRLTHQADTLGHVTNTVHDGLDRPRVVTRFSGEAGSDDEVNTTAYHPGGQVLSTTNAKGATTTFTLDGLNRVVATRTTLGDETEVFTTATDYDFSGNAEFETDRRGVRRRNTYDALNRLRRALILSGPDASPIGEVATFEYDAAGHKIAETGVAGLRTDFEYDGLYRVRRRLLPESGAAGRYFEETIHDTVGNLHTSRDANGHVTQFFYDELNRLIRSVNAEGHVRTFTYDDPEGSHVNKSEELDLTRGLRTEFRYDALNREIERTVRLEGAGGAGEVYVTRNRYADTSHAVTVTDARDTDTTVRLDGLDRVVEQVVDSGNGRLNLQTLTRWDGLGNRREVVDPRQLTTVYDHDGLGRLVRVQDATGGESRATYDGEGQKTSETDRRGVRKNFTYDNLRRLRRTELVPMPAMSGVPWSQETRYLDRDRKRVDVDARGKETVLFLDGLDRVVKLTDPRGKSSLTGWDGVDKRAETDKRGHTTLFDYDRLNRLIRARDPVPFQEQTLETTYDDASNRRTEKDRLGILTVTQMDPLGRVLAVTRAGVRLEAHSYDEMGNRLTSLDAEGKDTRFGYDRANRLASRTDGFGSPEVATTTFEYDDDGNQTEERDQRAADLGRPFSVKRTYDPLNRLDTQTDGESHTTTFEYDAEGNRTLVREPLGQETRFDYDELGKLTRVIQPPPAGGEPSPVTVYAYDPSRNRIRQTDANQHDVRMDYDELNRLETMAQDPDALNLVTRYDYDENGNQVGLRDPKGQSVTSVFDELNRLKTRSYAFADDDPYRPWRHTTSIGYTYDANGNPEEITEFVASGADPPAPLVTVREYDDFNRLLSETSPLPDGGTRAVSTTYWLNGARKTVTDPAAQVTTYAYDGQNRLASATTAAGITRYTYWPDDLPRTVLSANGVQATYAYDLADRLLSIANASGPTAISSYGYGYDANGNRLSQVEVNGGATEATSYTYDGLNRLETITYPGDAAFPAGRVVTYGYDAVGNRTAETVRKPDGALLAQKQGVFDNVNRLTALNDLVQPSQSIAFGYDRNGNQVTKTVGATATDYRYDVRDRMVEVGQAASILGRFQYDFDGRRIKKIGEEGVRQYVYDQTSLFAEYDENGLQKAKYDYGSDRLISLTRSDEGRRFFSFDGLRSVTNLTDSSGAAVASYHLDAWGNFRFPTELDASKNRFGFTSYIWDKETSLFFAQARFYDPEVGRFTSQDSFLGQVDDPPSLHRYFYANANPVRYVDPTGHAASDLAEAARKQGRIDTDIVGMDINGRPIRRSDTPATPIQPQGVDTSSLDEVDLNYFTPEEQKRVRGETAPAPQVVHEASPDEKPSLLRRALNAAGDALGYVPRKAQEIAQENGTSVLRDAFGANKPRGSLTKEELAWGRDADLLPQNRFKPVQEGLSEGGGYGGGILVRGVAEIVQDKGLAKGAEVVDDVVDVGKGAKRGPKPPHTGPHNLKVDEVGVGGTEHGLKPGERLMAGGGQKPERLIPTPGGQKEGRRPDVLIETPTGELRGVNVGKVDAKGSPVPREQDALDDLNRAGGIRTDYVPYDPKKK